MSHSREEIFAILVREHELAVLAFVRAGVSDRAAAEDVVQETFLTAWRRLDEYDRARPFAAWLRGIARNHVAEHYRKSAQGRGRLRVLEPEALTAIADELERLVHPPRGEVLSGSFEALRECLKTLAAADREMVELAYRDECGCRTIAERVGFTLEAVKKRLQRARAELRDCVLGKLNREEAREYAREGVRA